MSDRDVVDELLQSMLRTYGAPPGELAFDVIVENQRGMKLFGIPLFSGKSLFPLVDPSLFERVEGTKVLLNHDSISNYPLPDLDWVWVWDLWHVLMANDVDELGWVYLIKFLSWLLHWHGKYYFGDFVRRRLWVRLRKRTGKEEIDEVMEVLHVGS